jgi:hypothetical protein
MNRNLFFLILPAVFQIACSSAKNTASSMISQGIAGTVLEKKGNQMPMKGAPPSSGKPFITTVFIYEPTNLSQVQRTGTSPIYTAIGTKLVAFVKTDSSGTFRVQLPIGSYSLFIKQGNRYYANLFDAANNIAIFKVETGKITEANLVVSSGAFY